MNNSSRSSPDDVSAYNKNVVEAILTCLNRRHAKSGIQYSTSDLLRCVSDMLPSVDDSQFDAALRQLRHYGLIILHDTTYELTEADGERILWGRVGPPAGS